MAFRDFKSRRGITRGMVSKSSDFANKSNLLRLTPPPPNLLISMRLPLSQGESLPLCFQVSFASASIRVT
jgi:hypothetical protein